MERERERKPEKRSEAPFNAPGSTVHIFSPTFHPALLLSVSHFLIIVHLEAVYDAARTRAETAKSD